jgi:hypothetical protein
MGLLAGSAVRGESNYKKNRIITKRIHIAGDRSRKGSIPDPKCDGFVGGLQSERKASSQWRSPKKHLIGLNTEDGGNIQARAAKTWALGHTGRHLDRKLQGEFPTKHEILIMSYLRYVGEIGTNYIMFPLRGLALSFFLNININNNSYDSNCFVL